MILTYHKIGDQLELGITTVKRWAFGAHLDVINQAGMVTVHAAEAARSPGRRKIIAITFDDAYESVVAAALPEMEARGVTGTVFAIAGFVGDCSRWDVRLSPRRFRHASWDQLRDLADRGFEIGSHSMSHRDLTRLDTASLKRELEVSKKTLEDGTGHRVSSISYPFGRFSRRVVGEALEAGYTTGFTSYPRSNDDPMATGRMSVYSIDTLSCLKRKLGLLPGYRFECLKNRLIAGLSLGTTLVKR
jgi:peptidoglycan/xylan/chitin deacetylase (PgdA/CDA1 family)